jgi:RNA polymerase-interacting CarD/CdnL/TRCF family regulator
MPKNGLKLKVGDRVIDAGRVYRIFKIKKARNTGGEKVKTIWFKPQFEKGNGSGIIRSIPLESVKDAGIRRPISKQELKEVFEILEKKIRRRKVKLSNLKSKLNENKPEVTAWLLKRLWLDKEDEEVSFSPTKKRLYGKALRRLSEEAAYIKGTTQEKAQESIKKIMNGS